MQESEEVFNSLVEAGKYAHVGKQAIFLAIKRGELKAEKRRVKNQQTGRMLVQWVITKESVDEYRKMKYCRDKRVVDGQKLFDIEQDRWSVLHAAKALGSALGKVYPSQHIYYLIRMGKLRAMKKGNAWVISRKELIDLYSKEMGENPDQLNFA